MTRWCAILGLALGLLAWTGCAEQADSDQPAVEAGAKAPAAPAEGVVEESGTEAGAGAPGSGPAEDDETPE
jgi:hypothetical protein